MSRQGNRGLARRRTSGTLHTLSRGLTPLWRKRTVCRRKPVIRPGTCPSLNHPKVTTLGAGISPAAEKTKARDSLPGLYIFTRIQVNRGIRCDFEHGWQELSDRQPHRRSNTSMHQKLEQNHNTFLRTCGLCTWDISSV